MSQAEPCRAWRKAELTIAPESAQDLATRLARIEGQVRAISRTINEGRKCDLIVQQLSAARTALQRATALLMVTSLAQCIRSSGPGEDTAELGPLTESFAELI
ncbi:MAG: metal-sensitive transcriptional regulator [Vulcanimicrobiaceae bacterium]|jgi:DNA-binding FrmR family transcriptional regulator